MIVLEGPDGAGKSTLIKAIEKRLGIEATHFGGPPKYIDELHERVAASRSAKLLDRYSPISEQVYGPIANRQWSIDVMDTYIQQNCKIVIYCKPRRSTLMRNKVRCLEADKAHKSEQHCKMVSDNFERVLDGYERTMRKIHRLGVNVYVYDYEEPEALTKLFTFLEHYHG